MKKLTNSLLYESSQKRFELTIDLDISGGRNLNAVATEVSPDGQLVANLLGEDSIDGVGSAVGGGQGPAAAGVVGVGHVVHGTDRSNGSSARSYNRDSLEQSNGRVDWIL